MSLTLKRAVELYGLADSTSTVELITREGVLILRHKSGAEIVLDSGVDGYCILEKTVLVQFDDRRKVVYAFDLSGRFVRPMWLFQEGVLVYVTTDNNDQRMVWRRNLATPEKEEELVLSVPGGQALYIDDIRGHIGVAAPLLVAGCKPTYIRSFNVWGDEDSARSLQSRRETQVSLILKAVADKSLPWRTAVVIQQETALRMRGEWLQTEDIERLLLAIESVSGAHKKRSRRLRWLLTVLPSENVMVGLIRAIEASHPEDGRFHAIAPSVKTINNILAGGNDHHEEREKNQQ